MGILVFLHVEVDELRPLHALWVGIGIVDGGLIEFRHAADQLGKALLVVQRMSLGVDAGDLHADIVDVRFLQGFEIRVVALVGLAVAQHYLAQQIHVLADILAETGGQVFREVRTCCVDDDAAGITAQAPLDDGHGHPVEEWLVSKLLVHPEQSMVTAIEEVGDAVLVDQVLYPSGQFLSVAHLTCLVEHTDDELLVTGCGDHGAIHVLFALLKAC